MPDIHQQHKELRQAIHFMMAASPRVPDELWEQLHFLTMQKEYANFLTAKLTLAKPVGFNVTDDEIHPALFDFQRAVVKWALARGRAAIFAGTGLGKTIMQLEWARLVHSYTQQPVLILAPLAVNAQTAKEGEKIGLHVQQCESQDGVINGVNITNYEKLHRFQPEAFGAIVLDESSILKSFDGKTRKQLTEFSKQIYYRLACTATPSPNDLVEITNHSEFLDVMSGKEVIALYFTQDGNTTHKWRLKGHAKQDFYKWMASWCRAFLNPADLGFSESGQLFALPPIEYQEHIVESGREIDTLFAMGAKTLQEQRDARRSSLEERVQLAAEIVSKTDGPFVAWCNLNDESSALAKAIPDAVEVVGADSSEFKAKAMADFSDGKSRGLISKSSICGFGMNWQHCGTTLFVGIDHSFEQFYQAVRRFWRFGRKDKVTVHIIVSDEEINVIENIQRKERQYLDLMANLVNEMKDFQTFAQARNVMDYSNHKPMQLPEWIQYAA